MRAGQLNQFRNSGPLLDSNGILDDTTFELLYLAHLIRLFGDRHAFVDDTDTTLLRHCNRQTKFGNGIHGGGHHGNIQIYFTREPRTQ